MDRPRHPFWATNPIARHRAKVPSREKSSTAQAAPFLDWRNQFRALKSELAAKCASMSRNTLSCRNEGFHTARKKLIYEQSHH
jgi:hypothetical protein